MLALLFYLHKYVYICKNILSMNDPIYKQATTIGDGKSPVVINTSGKVVVKVNGKYFPLNFQEVTNSSTTIEDNDSFPIKESI